MSEQHVWLVHKSNEVLKVCSSVVIAQAWQAETDGSFVMCRKLQSAGPHESDEFRRAVSRTLMDENIIAELLEHLAPTHLRVVEEVKRARSEREAFVHRWGVLPLRRHARWLADEETCKVYDRLAPGYLD